MHAFINIIVYTSLLFTLLHYYLERNVYRSCICTDSLGIISKAADKYSDKIKELVRYVINYYNYLDQVYYINIILTWKLLGNFERDFEHTTVFVGL